MIMEWRKLVISQLANTFTVKPRKFFDIDWHWDEINLILLMLF